MRNLLMAGSLYVMGAMSTAVAGASSGPSQQRVEAGRQIYQQHCAACHGAKGEGQPAWQKRNAGGELPAPPHDPKGHTWKHSDGMLYRIIKNGWRDPFNKTDRVTMPAFGNMLSPGEIRDVVEYLKTLWTPAQRRTQRQESQKEPFPPEVNNEPSEK